jgi:hypothetical protein
MSDRPTPEVDANLVDISGAGATVHTRYVRADFACRLERQRNELLDFLTKLDGMACDDEYGSSDFRKTCRYDIPKAIAAAGRLEQHRDELMHALQRIDPFPNDEIEESWNGNTVYCEITVADIRLIRAAIARVKGGGA